MFASAALARSALCAAVMSIAAFALLASPARALRPQACAGSADIPSGPAGADAAADAVVCLVNAERTSRGLRPLKRDADLAQAARRHAGDMGARRLLRPHQPRRRDRSATACAPPATAIPGDGWKVGEDLGWGTGRTRAPRTWLVRRLARQPAAPPHPARRPTYRELGVGVAARRAEGHAPPARRDLHDGPRRHPP